EADYRVLPDKRVRIESWFDITGDSPRGARVQVFHADGSPLAEGILDANGFFVFAFTKPEALRVVVTAGMGHAKELRIPESALADGAGPDTGADQASAPAAPSSFADRSPKVQFRDILIALAFIFGLAAFVLSVRNTLALRERRRQGRTPDLCPSRPESHIVAARGALL